MRPERLNPSRFILALLLLLCIDTHAQTNPAEATTPTPLTLGDALELSFRQNPVIDAQRAAVSAAIDRQKAAAGLRLPRLDVAATYAYLSKDIKAFDLNPEKNAVLQKLGQLQLPIPIPDNILQAVQGLDLSLTLQKKQFAVVGGVAAAPIYTGGKINAAVNASKIEVEIKNVEAEKVRTDLFAETVERYYGLALAQRVAEVTTEVKLAMAKHLYDAEKLEENGMIARTEKLYAEMFLAQAIGTEESAWLETRTVNRALATSLNQDGEYLPVTALFIVDELPPLEHFREMTRRNSAVLQGVELTRRLAGEGVRLARSSFLPELVALGAVDIWNYQLTDLAPRWMVGAGLKLRIFDGLSSEYKYAAAKKDVRQVEIMQIKAENDIMTLVEKLYNQLLSSGAEVRSLGKSIEFARSYLDAKQKAFLEGLVPSSEVVDAHLLVSGTVTARLAAAYTFDITLAQLLALSGETETFETYASHPDYQIITLE